jgi:hypothetical protein
MTDALWRRETHQIHPANWAAALLATVLVIAGAIHLILMPEHLAESTLFGLGFCAAGIAQLSLAALVLARPWRVVFVAVIAVSLALMALYAYNVFVGLPFLDSPMAVDSAHGEAVRDEHASGDEASGHDEQATEHHEKGLVVGAGEPGDAFGAGTQAAQIAAVALAVYILRRARNQAETVSPAARRQGWP